MRRITELMESNEARLLSEGQAFTSVHCAPPVPDGIEERAFSGDNRFCQGEIFSTDLRIPGLH